MDDEVIRLITENQHLKIKCSTVIDNIDNHNHMNHSSVRPQSSNHRYEKRQLLVTVTKMCGSVNSIPTLLS